MTERKEVATLAGGCFWCLEAVFRRVKGVERVTSGYTGGGVSNPSYREVCAGNTGHAEAVRIEFDPEVITFQEILDIFWHIHDPTTLNRQGADAGTQYRSAIFYHDESQRAAAEQSLRRAEASRLWPDPIVTEITPAGTFYPAEEYHQEYYLQNAGQPYCRIVIEPKVRALLKAFPDKVR